MFLLWILTVSISASENTFIITGEISFRKEGSIYISLVSDDGSSEAAGQVIDRTSLDMNMKTVSFTFQDIPEGTYGIRIFQDLNGNGKLDSGAFGPKEPWGMSNNIRPAFRGPTFEEIQFEVNANIKNMNITLK